MKIQATQHCALSLATALALLSIPDGSPVYAQTPPSAQKSEAQKAKNPQIAEWYNKGVNATRINDWKTARLAFLEAWKLSNSYQIAANLGWAEYQLKLYRDAAEHLNYFLENAPDNLNSSEHMRIHDMFQTARRKVGALRIHVNVTGAEIFVNNRFVGVSPLKYPVFVDPGKSVLEARKSEYSVAAPAQPIEIEGGAPEQNINITLEKSYSVTAILIYGGAGLAGLSTGIASAFSFGMASKSRSEYQKQYDEIVALKCQSESDSGCAKPFASLKKSRDERAIHMNVAVGTLIGTGLIAASIATYWYLTRDPAETLGTRIHATQIGVAFDVDQRGGSASITLPW